MRQVFDTVCTCDVLHVPRSNKFDVSSIFAQPVADLAQQLIAQNNAQWLGMVESQVLSMSFAKDIESPVGVATIQVKPDEVDWFYVIKPGDILLVFSNDVGDFIDASARLKNPLVTVVVVDSVQRGRSVVNEATVAVVDVVGRDMTVPFVETSTVYDQAFAQIEQVLFSGTYYSDLIGRKQSAFSPVENILTLLRLIYDYDASQSPLVPLQWKLNTTSGTTVPLVSLIDITTFMQVPLPGYAPPDTAGVLQSGSVWELLKSYANPTLNELFVDVRDITAEENDYATFASTQAANGVGQDDIASQMELWQDTMQSQTFKATPFNQQQANSSIVALVLRQRPYDSKSFAALPVTVIPQSEVETSKLALSSHDVLNWFAVRFPMMRPEFQEVLFGALINVESVARFGYRRMQAETRYCFASSQDATAFDQGQGANDFSDILRFYSELLATWNMVNERMYAGSVTLRYRPRIRIGTRARLVDEDGTTIDCYVQGVHHSFSKEQGASRTMLTLVRGVPVGVQALETSLYWDGVRSQIPTVYGNTFGAVKLAGFLPANSQGGQ